MASLPTLFGGGLAALFLLHASATAPLSTTVDRSPARGHLVLVVEGDARGLSVTHAVHKADPLGAARPPASDVELRMYDGAGRPLHRQVVDTAFFDLDPARVGAGVRVEGCEVHDTRLTLLVNVPYFADLGKIEFRRGGAPFGAVEGRALTDLLAAAGVGEGR